MSKQTEAERLADELEMWTLGEPAAAELRRLVSFNQQLMDEVARLQNALAEQPAPVKPCPHNHTIGDGRPENTFRYDCKTFINRVELAEQPAREPLTPERIEAALKAACMHSTSESRKDMRRAIEAANCLAKEDLVYEYQKGFIDGQIDMRDRPEEQSIKWIAAADQMPPPGVRVFWMDQDSNRVGYDKWMGEDFRFTPSHWMPIPPIETAHSITKGGAA